GTVGTDSDSEPVKKIHMENAEDETNEENFSFPILELPAELSSKILSYMGKKELGVCLQSFSLDKVYAEWSKDKIIDSMTIKKDSNMEMAEFKCSRYYSSKIFKSYLSQICDRFNEVYEMCEIGRMTISVSPNARQLIDACKRIKHIDNLIISFPILELPAQLSSKILS
ncbi:hypothetical protein PFISCL1PPCAC_21869, partial [Pristionchus fissidentatus]